MTDKYQLPVRIPTPTHIRMKSIMKKNRMTNQNAFVVQAIEAICDDEESASLTNRLEKMVNILAENARIDREQSAKRHIELMAWLDALAQAVTEDNTQYQEFLKVVEEEKLARKGAN
jgi:hypothetical protein